MRIFSVFRKPSLVVINIAAFVAGSLAGISANVFCGGTDFFDAAVEVVSPFGALLVAMLKTIVVPIIFFSLISGASSLPIKKFGKLGAKILLFYFSTSVLATLIGVASASAFSPSVADPSGSAAPLMAQVDSVKSSFSSSGGGLVSEMLLGAFVNPFQALSESRFLAMIVFSILFGLAARAIIESGAKAEAEQVKKMLGLFGAIEKSVFKIVGWLMYYFPLGIFSLTFVNFAVYGAGLFGSYAEIALCVIFGILLMITVVYPAIIFIFCRENPYAVLYKMRAPIITAFATRSSVAALPVSLENAASVLKIRPEVSGFALSLGATINMDGVCLHLPVFVILAAGIFGLDISAAQMFLVVASVVFVSIGVGGVPGGSIFLLFMVLDVLKLEPAQTSTIVALALGINPLLDMFETACNVAGDNVGNYVVAKRSAMID